MNIKLKIDIPNGKEKGDRMEKRKKLKRKGYERKKTDRPAYTIGDIITLLFWLIGIVLVLLFGVISS